MFVELALKNDQKVVREAINDGVHGQASLSFEENEGRENADGAVRKASSFDHIHCGTISDENAAGHDLIYDESGAQYSKIERTRT